MFIIILRLCKYSNICIVHWYNSISNSRFLNLYRTDITQCQSQGSFNLYRTDITQCQCQGSFNLYLLFKIELKLTLCFLLESEIKHLVELTYIFLLLNYWMEWYRPIYNKLYIEPRSWERSILVIYWYRISVLQCHIWTQVEL